MWEYFGNLKDINIDMKINLNEILINAYYHLYAGLAIISGGKYKEWRPDAFTDNFTNCSCLNPNRIRSNKVIAEFGNEFVRAFNISEYLHESTENMYPVNREGLIIYILKINTVSSNIVDFYQKTISPDSTVSKKRKIAIRDSYIICRETINNLNKLIEKIINNETPAVFSDPDTEKVIPSLVCLPVLDGLVEIEQISGYIPD